MEGDITQLQFRLKDREEELKGKAKLLEVSTARSLELRNEDSSNVCLQGFQDELAALELQLNMSEQQKDRLQKENKELVDRWMARMGEEADAMNDASRFS